MRLCPSCGQKTFQAMPTGNNPSSGQPPQQPARKPSSGSPSSIQRQGPLIPTTQASHFPTSFEPAGHFNRLVAALIDSALVALGAGVPIGVAYAILGNKEAVGSPNPLMVVMILASLIVPYVYYTILHGSARKATVGKKVMGLILVTTQGEQLTKLKAFIRIILTALLPVAGIALLGVSALGVATRWHETLHESIGVALGLGFLAVYVGPFVTVLFNPRRQTFFDMLCGTCVIKNPVP